MGSRTSCLGAPVFGALLVVAGMVATAGADPKADIQAKTREAMESYDLMDYDAAKKSLTAAIGAAKKAKLDKDPSYAKAHLFLGIASFAGGDIDGTKAAFAVAAAIDPKIQIDAAYKSPELVKLLDAAKSEASTGGTKVDPKIDPKHDPKHDLVSEECTGVRGLQHDILDSSRAGAAQPIEVLVGSDITPAKVVVMYRTEGTTEFVEAVLAKAGGCKYVGQIPKSAMHGAVLHYFVAAYDAGNKVITSKGSSGSPNIMELAAAVAGGSGGDNEDPISGGGVKKKAEPSGGSISKSGGVLSGGKPPKVFIAVAGGTGFGYVTGSTEAGNLVDTCCIGNSWVVVTPELGFYVIKQLSIGIAGRIGLPLGANIDPPDAKHSTIAPAAVVRVRYALSRSGEGVHVMGQIGGGVMRNTITLKMQPGGGDTDIVAQGPLLVGAGIGFKKNVSNNLAFIADLSALAGIAVVDKLGTAKLNTGIGGDVTLGLAVGF